MDQSEALSKTEMAGQAGNTIVHVAEHVASIRKAIGR